MTDDELLASTRSAPLVSVDIIVRDRARRALVMLRTEQPAKGTLFNPGGRILRNEPLEQAFERVILREIGCPLRFADATFRGVYQHFYATNRFGIANLGTHYVVLAHEVVLDDPAAVRLDDTHSTYLWLNEVELLAHPDVHEYVKDYYRPARRTQHAAL
jgi:colanic acid biosynthesis protein WcaH